MVVSDSTTLRHTVITCRLLADYSPRAICIGVHVYTFAAVYTIAAEKVQVQLCYVPDLNTESFDRNQQD